MERLLFLRNKTYEFWLPGGKTSGGYNEAVLDNEVITHNNDINNLKNSFSIKEYK